MAESDDAQEKTEQPTPKRIQDAREEGNVARSRELSTAMVMTVAILFLWFYGPMFAEDLHRIASKALSYTRGDIYTHDISVTALVLIIQETLNALTPFFLVMFFSAVAAPLALGGWVLSVKTLSIKFERLDPVRGLKRVFGVQGLMELAKALAKFLLLTIAASIALWVVYDSMMALGVEHYARAVVDSMEIMLLAVLSLCIALFLVASVDVPFQLWNHYRKLKMSRQEIKDELKQTEGDPEMRGRIKSIQREMSRRRMMMEVPTADVVLVNPTHFAVALKYNTEENGAPKIVAKGTDMLAFKIREIAEHHSVFVYSEPALTRAIYFTTQLGQEIPRVLYVAVAQVLAYVHHINQARKSGEPEPDRPTDIEVPEELTKPHGRKY